jgi:hypothetical protein
MRKSLKYDEIYMYEKAMNQGENHQIHSSLTSDIFLVDN